MGEFEDQLNAVLSDTAAMEQIMALAQSLGAGKSQSAPDNQREESQSTESQQGSGLFNGLSGIDPKMLQIGMELFQEYQREDDRNTALLEALRPFLRKERQKRLDKAIQLARISRVVRKAYQTMKEKGGEEDV